MQFKKQQREELHKNWHAGSWFYTNLGPAARHIVERAYGLQLDPSPALRSKAQDDMTLALSIFARKVGCDKSHAVHALLSGSIESLRRVLERNKNVLTDQELRDAWEASFRDIIVG